MQEPKLVADGTAVKKRGEPLKPGEKFGKLTVIEYRDIHPAHKMRRYLFRCDCGNEVVRGKPPVPYRENISCGCGRRKVEPGKVFGRLTVIRGANDEEIPVGQKGAWYLCRCICGTERIIRGAGLVIGTTRSCGCLFREVRKSVELPRGHASRNSLLYRYMRGAKKRGLLWELPGDVFFELTSQACTYCGAPPSLEKSAGPGTNGTYTYTGIDRVDNKVGYVRGNVVPCCRTCNIAKRKMSVTEFAKWVRRVAGRLQTTRWDTPTEGGKDAAVRVASSDSESAV